MVIKNVSFGHSGNYTCEVTADTPSFSTATATAQMLVVGEFSLFRLMFYDCSSVCLCLSNEIELEPLNLLSSRRLPAQHCSAKVQLSVVDRQKKEEKKKSRPLTKFMSYFSLQLFFFLLLFSHFPCRTSWITTSTLHWIWSIWTRRCTSS